MLQYGLHAAESPQETQNESHQSVLSDGSVPGADQ